MAWRNSNINSFVREVNIITDHKHLIIILKKDMATLSQQLQSILLRIHNDNI